MRSRTCLICKRRLTDGTSVRFGMGPVCKAKKWVEIYKQGDLFMVEAIPDFGDVVCSRNSDRIHTNVPRRITRHSPDGFEWGYGGSGPADFALNILSVYIGQEAAQFCGLYQDFKWLFVAKLPKKGGTIRRDDVMRWVEANKEKIVSEGKL